MHEEAVLDAVAAAEHLAPSGVWLAPETLQVRRRDDRWVVEAPGWVGWIADTPAGIRRLQRERGVLEAIGRRCGVGVPRVVWTDGEGCDLRVPVPAGLEPWAAYRTLTTDPSLAAALGAQVGALAR